MFRTLRTSLSALALGALTVGSASASAEDIKICTVDLQSALGVVDEGREALETLTAELERRQEEINQQQEELEEWMAELEAQVAVLSQEERERSMQEYQERVMALQQAFQRNQVELSQAEVDATRGIADRMLTIVDEYANANGCTYVIQSSAVLFGPADADFTEELVEMYNARH